MPFFERLLSADVFNKGNVFFGNLRDLLFMDAPIIGSPVRGVLDWTAYFANRLYRNTFVDKPVFEASFCDFHQYGSNHAQNLDAFIQGSLKDKLSLILNVPWSFCKTTASFAKDMAWGAAELLSEEHSHTVFAGMIGASALLAYGGYCLASQNPPPNQHPSWRWSYGEKT